MGASWGSLGPEHGLVLLRTHQAKSQELSGRLTTMMGRRTNVRLD